MKPGLGVGVMILKDNKVLLGLRNPDRVKASSELKGEGTWTMPGGKVEFMEKNGLILIIYLKICINQVKW